MSSLLKHKIERHLINSFHNINNSDEEIFLTACNNASGDINRMLPFLTLISPKAELRAEHPENKPPIKLELICNDLNEQQNQNTAQQKVQDTKLKRLETAEEKKVYFDRVIQFILSFLKIKKFNLPKIKYDFSDASDNDGFASYCNKFIAELQKQKLSDKENSLKIDILINLLLSLAQYNYTLPSHAIMNLFPMLLALKTNSQRTILQFNEDIVNLSIQVSLIPNANKFDAENSPYEIILTHNLHANIFDLPNWTSTLQVQMENTTKNPPEIIALLEKVKFSTP